MLRRPFGKGGGGWGARRKATSGMQLGMPAAGPPLCPAAAPTRPPAYDVRPGPAPAASPHVPGTYASINCVALQLPTCSLAARSARVASALSGSCPAGATGPMGPLGPSPAATTVPGRVAVARRYAGGVWHHACCWWKRGSVWWEESVGRWPRLRSTGDPGCCVAAEGIDGVFLANGLHAMRSGAVARARCLPERL